MVKPDRLGPSEQPPFVLGLTDVRPKPMSQCVHCIVASATLLVMAVVEGSVFSSTRMMAFWVRHGHDQDSVPMQQPVRSSV